MSQKIRVVVVLYGSVRATYKPGDLKASLLQSGVNIHPYPQIYPQIALELL